MERKIKYTVQLGTAYDSGQHLIWALRSEKALAETNTIVPRMRFYNSKIAALVQDHGGAPATPDEISSVLSLDAVKSEDDLHFVMNFTDLMQPAQHFCPAGDWFYNLGARASEYRGLLSGSDFSFAISLRNPASLLSDAWVSEKYPGFDDLPPDPFALKWADVLADLRRHVPDAPIVAWCAEEAPIVWPQVLSHVIDKKMNLSPETEIELATAMMGEEGNTRLLQHLIERPHFTPEQRTRVIEIFLEKFAQDELDEPSIVIPEWTPQKQEQMDDHYAADLAEVAELDGVTLISA